MFANRKAKMGSGAQPKTGAASGRSGSAPGGWQALQRTVGNQAVLQMIGGDGRPARRKNLKDTSSTREERLAKTVEAAKKKRKNEKDDALAVRRGKYTPGMHGYKKSEQKRLSNAYGISVTGSTHESEHTIGFEPLNQTSGNKRGENATARSLENRAPAYQEVKELHRDHIGTGTHGSRDASGFNSEEYRNSQRSLLEAGDVSSAVQLNQLGYAFDPNKSALTATEEGKAATDSYDTMVANMNSVAYAQDDGEVSVGVDAKQKAEMYLARRAAITGKFPTIEEENAARIKFGLDPIADS